MNDEIKYKREGDNSFSQWVNGQPVAIFKIRNWMKGLLQEPDRRGGLGHVNRFQLTQYIEHGRWE